MPDVIIKGKDYKMEHELLRRKVWSDAFSRTASANDCKSEEVALRYATKALKAFDQEFKPL